MSARRFAPTREDGRSNAQVVIDLVRDGTPGTLYLYDELINALNAGSTRVYGRHDVWTVVSACTPRLLGEQSRRLRNVRLMGYQLSPASEHMTLAHRDKRRADTQLRRGLQTLRHVRWEELDDNTRRAHEGHLMLTEAIYANQMALERRVRKIEDVIQGLKG